MEIKAKRESFTNEEIEYLKENVGKFKIKTIAKNLNKSVDSIYIKACRIGYTNPQEVTGAYSLYEISRIAKWNYGTVKRIAIETNCPTFKVPHGKNDKNVYLIEADDFWNWIEPIKHRFNFSSIPNDFLMPHPDWLKEEKRKNFIAKNAKWTQEEESLLKAFRNNGYSYKEISDKLGRSTSAISNKVCRVKIKKLNKLPWREIEVEMLISMLKDGLSYDEIAYELGRDKKSVANKIFKLRKINYMDIKKINIKETQKKHRIKNTEKIEYDKDTWINEEIEEMIKLIKSGKTSTEVSQILQKNKEQILSKMYLIRTHTYDYLETLYNETDFEENLHNAINTQWEDEEVEKLISLINEGKSYSEISKYTKRYKKDIVDKVDELKKNNDYRLIYMERSIKIQIQARWKKEEVEKLVSMLQQGKSHNEIAKTLKKEITQVSSKIYRMKKNNDSRLKEAKCLLKYQVRIPWKDEEIKIMVDMLKEGKSYLEISHKLKRKSKNIINKVYYMRKNNDIRLNF